MPLAPVARFTRLNAVRDQRDDYFPDTLIEWRLKIQFTRALQFVRVGHKRRSARTMPAEATIGVTLH
ncbi:MAG: hypothetical protein JWP25_8571 [Bradyrhizobium sp.]|nr:hypothetical protein [Bradyrhizobium sp.]